MKSYAEALAIVEGREYIPPPELPTDSPANEDDVNRHLPWPQRLECMELLKELDLPTTTDFARAKQIKAGRLAKAKSDEAWARRIQRNRYTKSRKAEIAARKAEKQENERLKSIKAYDLPPDATWSEAMASRKFHLEKIRLEQESVKQENERQKIIKDYDLPLDTTWLKAIEIRKSELVKTKLKHERIRQEERLERERERLGIGTEADIRLADELDTALRQSAANCCGYLYVKVWVMPDGATRWYKVGITNEPNRRHSEQNVLPVPAESICLVSLPSMEHARAAERAVLMVLDKHRILGANNKELFHLKPDELAALLGILERLKWRVEG